MTTGFERDRDEFARGARAIVVLPDQGNASRDADARLAETAGLAAAIGVEVAEKIVTAASRAIPAAEMERFTNGLPSRPEGRTDSTQRLRSI